MFEKVGHEGVDIDTPAQSRWDRDKWLGWRSTVVAKDVPRTIKLKSSI